MKRRVFLLGMVLPGIAPGCTCVSTEEAAWPFPKGQDGEILFRGTVLRRQALAKYHPPYTPDTYLLSRYAATFRVDEYWRGQPARTVTVQVLQSDSAGDCYMSGPGHAVGAEYLVLSYLRDQTYHAITACVPVGLAKDLPAVLKALGPGKRPAV